ncbi:hypothetical protein HDZ31DRAFT_76876 [Schizophyllum fasciatum]
MPSSIVLLPCSILRRVSSALFASLISKGTTKDPANLLCLPNETLSEIACFLDNPDLCALALVNIRLSAVAEPHIWRELSSLVPILRLLPEFFTNPNSYSGVSCRVRCLCRAGPALPEDIWDRRPDILRLASHVRKLLIHPISLSDVHRDCMLRTFSQNGYISTDRDSLKALAKSVQIHAGFMLFPRLQHVEVNSNHASGISSKFLGPLMSPNVTTFVAHCSVGHFERCIQRSSIGTYIYDEQRPAFRGPPKPALQRDALLIPMIRTVSSTITAIHTLRLRLTYARQLLPFLHPAAHTLHSLDLEVFWLADSTADYGLVELRSLTVRRQCAAFARALAGSMHLEDVALYDVSVMSSEDMNRALDRIGQGALRRVHIQQRAPPQSAPWWSFHKYHIDALTACNVLVELDIYASDAVALSDDDWAAVVPSWPCLRRFKLLPCEPRRRSGDAPVMGTHTPSATLACLIPFAINCPNLEELGMHICLGAVPALARELHFVTSRLRKLDLGRYSAIREAVPDNIVAFLRALFPALRDFQMAPSRAIDVDMWEQMRDALASDIIGRVPDSDRVH